MHQRFNRENLRALYPPESGASIEPATAEDESPEARLAKAMQEASTQEQAGAAEAGFCDVWRARAAAAVDVAVREARAREEQPEVDAYGRLEGLHDNMGALLLEAERADAEDNAAMVA